MRQQTLGMWIKGDHSDESEEISQYIPTPSRTAAAEKYYWTRVKNLRQMQSQRIQIFDVANDLQWDKNLQRIRKGITNNLGAMLFDPDEYKKQDGVLTYQRSKLDQHSLLEYAELASNLRAKFLEKAASYNGKDELL